MNNPVNQENDQVIQFLKNKEILFSAKKVMVRIPYHDPVSCLDFEYVPIGDLINQLEKSEITLTISDLGSFVEI
jgi:hypothetical protein